jgi:hypothetical protein
MNLYNIIKNFEDGKLTQSEFNELVGYADSKVKYGQLVTAFNNTDDSYVELTSGADVLSKGSYPFFYSFLKNNNLITSDNISIQTFQSPIYYSNISNLNTNLKNYIYVGPRGTDYISIDMEEDSFIFDLNFGSFYNEYNGIRKNIFINTDSFYSNQGNNFGLASSMIYLRNSAQKNYNIYDKISKLGEDTSGSNYSYSLTYKDLFFTVIFGAGISELKEVEISCDISGLSSLSSFSSTPEPFAIKKYIMTIDEIGNKNFFSTFTDNVDLFLKARNVKYINYETFSRIEKLNYKKSKNNDYTYVIEEKIDSPCTFDVFFFSKNTLTPIAATDYIVQAYQT